MYSCSVPVLSDCLSKFIPWSKNKAALTQSHPGWAGGGDGLRGSWEDFQEGSPVLQLCQELKVPRAPEGLQVGMLVWNSPGNVSMASGSTESSELRKNLGKGIPASGSFSSWAAPEPRGISWITRRTPKVFSCPVLRAGLVYFGGTFSCSWFPSLPHPHPGIP